MELRRTHYILFGLILAAALINMLLPFVNVLVYGLFVYYIARPTYRRLNRGGKYSTISAFFSLVIIVLPVIIIMTYTVGIAAIELKEVLVSMNIPGTDVLTRVSGETIDVLEKLGPEEVVQIIGEHQNLGMFILGLLGNTLNIVFRFLLIIAVSYYLLKNSSKARAWALKLFCEKDSRIIKRYMNEVDDALTYVFFGNILNAGFTAVMGGITFSLLNYFAPSPALSIPYPVLFGILCGIGSLIPVIGMKLVWVPLFSYVSFRGYLAGVLAEQWWFLAAFLLAVNIIVDIIPDMIIRPYVSSRRAPGYLMFFSYIFGTAVYGIAGLFIGPIIVVLLLNFMRIILPELKKR